MPHVRRSSRLAAALAAAFFVHAAPALAADATSPQGWLKGELPDSMPAAKKVFIHNFVIQYVVQQSVESRRSNDTYHARWDGLSPAQMQGIANALHARLAAELAAAGVEVVPHEALQAQPALEDLRGSARPSPLEVVDSEIRKVSLLVSAQGLPVVVAPLIDQKIPSYATQPAKDTNVRLLGIDEQLRQWLAPGNAETFKLVGVYGAQAKLAQALGAMPLSVRVALPLVNMGIVQKVGGFGVSLLGGGEYGLVEANPRIVEGGTVFTLSEATRPRVMALQQPLPLPEVQLAVEHQGEGDAKGKVRGRGGLIGALFGAAGGQAKDADALVKVDAASLEAALLKAGGELFKDYAQTLAAAR